MSNQSSGRFVKHQGRHDRHHQNWRRFGPSGQRTGSDVHQVGGDQQIPDSYLKDLDFSQIPELPDINHPDCYAIKLSGIPVRDEWATADIVPEIYRLVTQIEKPNGKREKSGIFLHDLFLPFRERFAYFFCRDQQTLQRIQQNLSAMSTDGTFESFGRAVRFEILAGEDRAREMGRIPVNPNDAQYIYQDMSGAPRKNYHGGPLVRVRNVNGVIDIKSFHDWLVEVIKTDEISHLHLTMPRKGPWFYRYSGYCILVFNNIYQFDRAKKLLQNKPPVIKGVRLTVEDYDISRKRRLDVPQEFIELQRRYDKVVLNKADVDEKRAKTPEKTPQSAVHLKPSTKGPWRHSKTPTPTVSAQTQVRPRRVAPDGTQPSEYKHYYIQPVSRSQASSRAHTPVSGTPPVSVIPVAAPVYPVQSFVPPAHPQEVAHPSQYPWRNEASPALRAVTPVDVDAQSAADDDGTSTFMSEGGGLGTGARPNAIASGSLRPQSHQELDDDEIDALMDIPLPLALQQSQDHDHDDMKLTEGDTPRHGMDDLFFLPPQLEDEMASDVLPFFPSQMHHQPSLPRSLMRRSTQEMVRQVTPPDEAQAQTQTQSSKQGEALETSPAMSSSNSHHSVYESQGSFVYPTLQDEETGANLTPHKRVDKMGHKLYDNLKAIKSFQQQCNGKSPLMRTLTTRFGAAQENFTSELLHSDVQQLRDVLKDDMGVLSEEEKYVIRAMRAKKEGTSNCSNYSSQRLQCAKGLDCASPHFDITVNYKCGRCGSLIAGFAEVKKHDMTCQNSGTRMQHQHQVMHH